MQSSISIALTTYNGEKYLEKQLSSLFSQTRRFDELVIVDDCSTDTTTEILEELSGKNPEFNIKFFRNEKNLGYIRNFQKAIELCTGDIIFLCDQDDIWYDTKIAEMTELMENNSSISLLACSFDFIDGKDSPVSVKKKAGYSNNNLLKGKVGKDELKEIGIEKLVFRNFTQGCACCFTREVAEEFLKVFDENIPHDWQLNMIAAAKDGLYFYNRALFAYRLHGDNTTGLFPEFSGRQKMTYEYRSGISSVGIRNSEFINKHYPGIYGKRNLDKKADFSRKHNRYLKNRSFFRLLFQNFNPSYSEICTFKGRLTDLAFCIYRG